MSVTVRRSAVDGTLQAPPSKSYTHRAYILAALSGNGTVRGPLQSDDTRATLACLHALGFLVNPLPHETRVGGVMRPPKSVLKARNSGTTLRLLAAVAGLGRSQVRFDADPSLRRRPMRPLLDALAALGVRADSTDGCAPLSVTGPLRGGRARMSGDVSSQFVSALLLACPLAASDTTLAIEGAIRSRPYVDVTLDQLKVHGVRVAEEHGVFQIPGGQKVRQRPFEIPGDWSNAAFALVAAAITGGRVTVQNLKPEDPQGDRAILDVLRDFGADVRMEGERATVVGGPLAAHDVNLTSMPDLFPPLAVLAACAKGTSVLRGAPQLRLKESDRVHAMAANLRAAGIQVEELPDGLRVTGGIPKGITIQSFDDHRIAMAMLVLGLASDGATALPDDWVVAKSYPNFHNDLGSIAAEVARA